MNLFPALILALVAIMLTRSAEARYDCATFKIERACDIVHRSYSP